MTAPQTPTPGVSLSAEGVFELTDDERAEIVDRAVDGFRDDLKAIVTPSDQREQKPRSWNEVIQSDDFKALSTTPASGSDGLETVGHFYETATGEWVQLDEEEESTTALVTREAAEKRIGEERARADRAEERISELADLFGVCDGGRYLNDWKARLNAHQSQVAALKAALPDLTSVIGWLANGCDPQHAVTELRIYQDRIQALALKEGR